MKALIVVTNVAQFGALRRPTGLWLSEATHFHKVMADHNIGVDYVSPTGGYVPLDPGSIAADAIDDTSWHFYANPDYRQKYLANSLRPDQVNPADYDIIYYAGGHGTMWDFPTSTSIAHIAKQIYANGGVISAVCHGVVGLLAIQDDGKQFIAGKQLTGFTNDEEAINQLTDAVPFLAEDALRKAGSNYSKSTPYTEHVVTDGRLVTGQNPQSAHGVGVAALAALGIK